MTAPEYFALIPPPAAPPTVEAAAAFLLEHGASPRGWPPGILLPWLDWHWRRGHVGVVRRAGAVVAVGVARPVRDLAQAKAGRYEHDENGPLLWVDELASLIPEGLPILLTQAVARFGPRASVCGDVFNRPGKLRMLPWKTVDKLIRPYRSNVLP